MVAFPSLAWRYGVSLLFLSFTHLHLLPLLNAGHGGASGGGGLTAGNRKLRLLCLNNLGKLEEQLGKLQEALQHYCESVELTSATNGRAQTWHRLGVVAVSLRRFRLARYAFEQGASNTRVHKYVRT